MRTQTEQNERTLEEVAPGERGVILQVGNENGPVKRRLVDMGLTPGTEVTVRKVAPFGDPVELNLRGYELSLRKADAAQIRVATGAEGERRAQTRRRRIGMVLQTNVLFTGTIRENLKWGKEDATEEEIIQAAKDAQAYDFIMALPDGFDTMLTQGGTNVSGGQKQRLCIARAMLRKPAVLILDDSTSAVDSATEAAIRESFAKNLKDTTVIIIAQRISSVQYADEILILEDDHIAAHGTHDELLKSSPIYQEIYQSQQEGVGE